MNLLWSLLWSGVLGASLLSGAAQAQECATCWSDTCSELRAHLPKKCGPKRPGERGRVAPRRGTLTVLSEPSGTVHIDGEAAGRTPLRKKRLTPDEYLVTVDAPGHAKFVKTVEVTAGKETKVVAALEARGGATASTVALAPAPPPTARRSCPAGMVLVPGGTFRMGSTEGDDETPQHEVTLGAYCLDRTEVTVGAYSSCARGGGCPRAAGTVAYSGSSAEDVTFWSHFCNGGRTDLNDHPMNCVDWSQASAFCAASGKRLPTEAEWEYAARGNDGRRYPWGNEAPSPTLLNACGSECRDYAAALGRTGWPVMYEADDGWRWTAPVGSFPSGASPFGLQDMAGNVWEWVADTYVADGYARHVPTNPEVTGDDPRVNRGGSWVGDDPSWVRAAFRGRDAPSDRVSLVGFRCARGAGP